MNNKELIEKLSERLGVSKNEISKMLAATTQSIVQTVDEDRSITLQGFGLFEVRRKQDRILFNPASGRQMIVPPKLTLVFKPSDTYKEKLK
ncbi:MAG: HU family DNA-binding protein [Paludibacteraceae bacterium]|nr:HU family DNA-binding protein [Paludibacteraceae bacterium]MBQ1852097.1 HU family DNA-binding protein [Paludibacteraceae bacterium]